MSDYDRARWVRGTRDRSPFAVPRSAFCVRRSGRSPLESRLALPSPACPAPEPASYLLLRVRRDCCTMHEVSDRKYRQRGYQDEPPKARSAPRPERPAAEPRAPGRPFQDAAGPRTPNLMGSHEVFRCARCGNRLSSEVAVDTRCSRCGVAVHACINCVSFDTSARWECTLSAELHGTRVPEGRAQPVPTLCAENDDRA